jgi:hypothetical protein
MLDILLCELVLRGCEVELSGGLFDLLWGLGGIIGDDGGLVDFVCDWGDGKLFGLDSWFLCNFGRLLDGRRSGLLGRLSSLGCGLRWGGLCGLREHARPGLLRSDNGVLRGLLRVVEHL